MVIFGELLMVIGTILLVVASFMTDTVLGIVVSGITSLVWGLFLLKIASMNTQSKGGDNK